MAAAGLDDGRAALERFPKLLVRAHRPLAGEPLRPGKRHKVDGRIGEPLADPFVLRRPTAMARGSSAGSAGALLFCDRSADEAKHT